MAERPTTVQKILNGLKVKTDLSKNTDPLLQSLRDNTIPTAELRTLILHDLHPDSAIGTHSFTLGLGLLVLGLRYLRVLPEPH